MELVEQLDFDVNLRELQKLTEDNIHKSISFRFGGFSVQHRKGICDPWALYDGLESLKEYNDNTSEKDFAELHKKFVNSEFVGILKHFNLYRTRILRLEHKTCYKLHKDMTKRLHIPIFTNENCFFYFPDHKKHYHLEEGKVYLVDTTKLHTFVNAYDSPRVHMVGCTDINSL